MWDNWFVPLAHDLYEQMDKEFVSECNVQIRDMSKILKRAQKYYLAKREVLKKDFYGDYHKGDSVFSHRMDFHKIGAIIARTIIEYKVFSFDISKCRVYVEKNKSGNETDWVVRNALINFRFAFYASVVFLYQSMLFVYRDDELIRDELIKNKSLNLYTNSDETVKNSIENKVHESFENCMVLDFAKRDIGNRSFDYFMYAIVLYQLEEHNIHMIHERVKDY